MTKVRIQKRIAAPPAFIFHALVDVQGMPSRHPAVLRTEFLSDQREGVGTRFREVRQMGKKEFVSDLEITEFEPGQRVRMVTENHGTVWDTLFVLTPEGAGSLLEVEMDARAQKLMPRLLNPIFKGLFRRGLVKHFDVFAAWCEANANRDKVTT